MNPDPSETRPRVAVQAEGIRKRFGSVMANRAASLEVPAGQIHAVVGENGAGKSTLMRILAGLYPPDAGSVRIHGRDVTGWNTRQAIAAGVGMVHQHFMLVPTLTVAENLVLGRETVRGVRFDRDAAEREVRSLGERTGLVVSPQRRVAELSVGEAQRVEILKVLWRGARILILDEPTAVLSPLEVRELWRVIRRLRDDGDTIVLITHKLDEVMEVSDAVTVMRNGETVGRLATSEASPGSLARMMVGRDVALIPQGGERREERGEELHEASSSHVAASGDEQSDVTRHPSPVTRHGSAPSHESRVTSHALSVRDLVVPGSGGGEAVRGISFDIAAGEIFGIAGVEGNGQTELIEAIAGLRQSTSGRILLLGRDITRLPVSARAEAGLSHIPEDRHRRGLVLDYSVADNLVLGRQHRFSRRGVMDRAGVARHAAERISAFDIRPPVPQLPARSLSGGNQQKVVIAREMGREFAVLLASQPTRGVDVGAIEFIHARIRAARAAGRAVLLVSADLVEVLALSDRVGVLYGGRLVVTLPRAAASADVLAPYMTGASGSAA